MLTHSEIIVKLMSLPSVGRKTAFKLLDAMKHPVETDQELIEFVQINSKLIKGDLTAADFKKAIDKAEDMLSKSLNAGIQVINFYDDHYPKLLKGISDPPILLYAKGPVHKLNEMPSIAVIGTRGPSDHGFKVGQRLGEVFGKEGFNVVSGLAIGCDTAGHTGCLKVNGFTTAVLAHGLHTIYPKENKQLAGQILESGGVLLTEYMIGQGSQANFFVERDRIQAGLSQAIVVVETDIKGGTMHTVKFASTYNRIVTAFNHDPKYLGHPKTQGNQYLIKNHKARPISSSESIAHLKNQLLDTFELIIGKPLVKEKQQLELITEPLEFPAIQVAIDEPKKKTSRKKRENKDDMPILPAEDKAPKKKGKTSGKKETMKSTSNKTKGKSQLDISF